MRFYVVVVPASDWSDGYELWRSTDDRVYREGVAVTDQKDAAVALAKENGQYGFLSVETQSDLPNGYLVVADPAELDRVFNRESIHEYICLYGNPFGLPSSFAVVGTPNFGRLPAHLKDNAQPVYFEYIYV